MKHKVDEQNAFPEESNNLPSVDQQIPNKRFNANDELSRILGVESKNIGKIH